MRGQPEKGPHVLTHDHPCTEVRLVEEGDSRIASRQEVESMAEEQGLDVILLNPNSDPPVVRLMDYGKFKFEREKREREAKKKQHVISIKEVKLGIRIDENDYNVKLNRAKKFLAGGDKVKFTIRLRGREVQHRDLAIALAERVKTDLAEDGMLEGRINHEHMRQMSFTFQPAK